MMDHSTNAALDRYAAGKGGIPGTEEYKLLWSVLDPPVVAATKLVVDKSGDLNLQAETVKWDLHSHVFQKLHRRPADSLDDLRSWIYTVALNRGRDLLREERRRQVSIPLSSIPSNDNEDGPSLAATMAEANGPSPERSATLDELRTEVRIAAQSSPAGKAVALLLTGEVVTITEAARALGENHATLGKRVRELPLVRELQKGEL